MVVELENIPSMKIEYPGLMSMKARINEPGSSYKDVLGWDILCREGGCYEFYVAQYPLIGMTRPVEVPCPLGIQPFDSYNVSFQEALEKLNGMDCGDKFVALSLYWPLTPECKEPYWYIRTDLGTQVSVGANSGTAQCHKA